MKVLCIGLFALAALIHLGSLFFANRRLSSISKVFLLPLLLGVYLVTAKQYLPAAILGGIFGWVGDALLLRSSRRTFFILGLVSFLLGHLAYIGAFLSFIPGPDIPALVISLGAALVLGIFILRLIRPGRTMRIPVICYSIILELMCLCALQFALFRRDLPGLVIFAGSLCFIVSDTLLAYSTFRSMPKGGHFFIMLFYIAAQSCILTGLSMI